MDVRCRGRLFLLSGGDKGANLTIVISTQNRKTHKITDYFSFYSLPSTIIKHPKHNLLNAAYLFYYATETAFEEGAEESGRLKKRLEELVGDALIVADNAKFDVLNAMTLMDNVCFLSDMRVGLKCSSVQVAS